MLIEEPPCFSVEIRSSAPGPSKWPLGSCLQSLCIAVICQAVLWLCYKMAKLSTREGMHPWESSGGFHWTVIWQSWEISRRSVGPTCFGICDSCQVWPQVGNHLRWRYYIDVITFIIYISSQPVQNPTHRQWLTRNIILEYPGRTKAI